MKKEVLKKNKADLVSGDAPESISFSDYIKKQIGRWLSIVLPILLGFFLIFYTYIASYLCIIKTERTIKNTESQRESNKSSITNRNYIGLFR